MINGIGKKHFGESNYILDERSNDEEFDTTQWFVFLWLPIFPLKSYRIRQKYWSIRRQSDACISMHNGGLELRYDNTFIIIKEYKLNWKRAIKTYFFVHGTILLLFVVFGYVMPNFVK